jgi:hypothetical protein
MLPKASDGHGYRVPHCLHDQARPSVGIMMLYEQGKLQLDDR